MKISIRYNPTSSSRMMVIYPFLGLRKFGNKYWLKRFENVYLALHRTYKYTFKTVPNADFLNFI